jgi:inhibitor of KinA
MRIERLSERAVLLRDLPQEPFTLARLLNERRMPAPFQLEEAVASYETLGIYFSVPVLDLAVLEEPLGEILDQAPSEAPSRQLAIPVCYELGDDLAQAAATLGLSTEELIRLHSGTSYRCYAVGFSPGFAYLGYLDDRIASLPRLPSPRKRVEPGSVGITGRQTAVYPSSTPGGWNLIGRCPLEMVNVSDGYFPIEAGDQVSFQRVDEAGFARLKGERL